MVFLSQGPSRSNDQKVYLSVLRQITYLPTISSPEKLCPVKFSSLSFILQRKIRKKSIFFNVTHLLDLQS